VLPLRDKNPSGITPWVTYALIAANCLVFVLELGLDEPALKAVAVRFGMVPSRVTEVLRGQVPAIAGLVVPAFTSMFLHGGWAHLLGNMWFLFIFGDNVEGRTGHLTYLTFYLVCGVVAGATQYAINSASQVPCIGASGAIAGVLGAYIACWPHARILTLVPVFIVLTLIELPAALVLGFWFLIQFFQGTASIGIGFTHGVAYWAHVGGFVTGLLLIRLIPARRRPPRTAYERPDGRRWRARH
jgi:membrane associated rhomboid family serine protease